MRKTIHFFLSISFLFLINTTYAANTDCQAHQCVAVVDVGSTGSRLHIYAFDFDNTKTATNIKELWVKKTKPGFATIDMNQESVNRYLDAIFTDAPQKNIPVYFYATAGMRLLSKPKQNQLYSFVQNWFGEHGDWQLNSSKTISGSEEGVYGWLAVNYQLERLQNTMAEPVGVMDMGGASVQVSFPVKREAIAKQEDVQEIDLYGRHFKLFTHSFLGLGQTELSHQFLDNKSCFSNDYELPGGESALGDAYLCETDVASLLNQVHHVSNQVKPVLDANPVDNWYVLGGMAEMAKSLPFHFNNFQYDNQTLIEQANTELCHQSWPFLMTQYPTDDYLYGYCLFSAYYYALMVDGYGIEPQKAISYMQPTQSSDWTIGVVLLNLKGLEDLKPKV